MSSSWIVVIGTLGGVFITACVGLVTAYLSGRQRVTEYEHQSALERERRIRDERRNDYMEYLTAYRAMYQRALIIAAQGGCMDSSAPNLTREGAGQFEQAATEEVLAFSRAFYALQISGSKQTREAANKATGTLWDLAAACARGDQASIEEANTNANEPRRRLREAMRSDMGIE